MSNTPAAGSSVLDWVRDHVVVVALILAAAVVAAWLVFSGTGGEDNPEAKPVPTGTATLGAAAPVETTDPTGDAETPEAGAEPAGQPEETVEPSPEPTETPVVGPANPEEEITVGNGPQAPEIGDWRPTAEAFSAAWSNTDGGKDAWLKRLRPLVSDKLYEGFEYTDLRAVPSDEFDSVISVQDGGSVRDFNANYADGGVRFTGRLAIQPDGTWLVDAIIPPAL